MGNIVGFKGRSLDEDTKSKYINVHGVTGRLFNLRAINDVTDTLVITEGEIDCITVTQLGYPCIAVPGVNAWHAHSSKIVEDLPRLVFVADNDGDDFEKKGGKLVAAIRHDLPDTVIIRPPGGCKDANEALLAGLGDELVQMIREAGK